MAKNKEKTSNHYANLEPSDSNFLNKVDAKITEFQKQNKKYALDFYYNAKQFVLNTIEMKKTYKAEELNILPKRFLDLISDRDIDKLYNGFLSDTKSVAKVLFSEDMSMEDICACAIEYVRLCSSNFKRYEAESERKKESEIAEKFSVGYNGVLSFYFGLASDIDRGQLLARLINCGIDIKHSIAYCECVVDAYGDPITQIIEFKGKPMVAISSYNGVIKTYNKNIEKLSNLYQFLDFGESIDLGRKRALQAFKKFHNFKDLLNKTDDLAKSLEETAKVSHKNMSNLTPSEHAMLVNAGDRVVNISTLFELAIYERQKEYELIPDLFDTNIATIKLKQDDLTRFKAFPNKVIDEEYNLNHKRSYILNKNNKEKEEDLHSDDFADELSELDDQTEMELQSESDYKPISLDDIKPVPAIDVLNNLQVKFTPNEEVERIFEFDGATFDLSNPAMLAIGETKSVDLEEAEKERLLFEKEMGIESNNEVIENIGLVSKEMSRKKKKSFYDVLDEISEKVEKSRASNLQERYAEIQSNNELNLQNASEIVDSIEEENDFNEEYFDEDVIEDEYDDFSDKIDGYDDYTNENDKDSDENQQYYDKNESFDNENIDESEFIEDENYNEDGQETIDEDLEKIYSNLIKQIGQQNFKDDEEIEMNPDYLQYEEEYDDDYYKEVNKQLYDDELTDDELEALQSDNENSIDDFDIFEMQEENESVETDEPFIDDLEEEYVEDEEEILNTVDNFLTQISEEETQVIGNIKGESKEYKLERQEVKKVEALKENGIKENAISTQQKPKVIPKLPPKLLTKKQQPPKLPKRKS